MATQRPKPTCKEVRTWLTTRLGPRSLGALTGTTSRAFSAYLHLLDAWAVGRGVRVEAALRATLAILQPSEWLIAAWAIPAVADWSHVAELWPRIKPADAPDYEILIEAGEPRMVVL